MINKHNKIRVRFAPSPTGPFTIGSARTALFNWLYAKSKGGEFLLRIEDTDEKRSKKGFEDNIIESLTWLGLDWDGDIKRQSDRLENYESYIKKLLKEDKAYYCFCTKKDLDEQKEKQMKEGQTPKYSGKCSKISKEEANDKLANGEEAVIRFRAPSKRISFGDIIRGEVSFNTSDMGDFVIAKNLKKPLYNLAVVIDDHDMEITHVIRGEDHISNTPRQILLQEALDFTVPKFAHLPLILNPDGGKLSKRVAKKSITDYRDDGYIPESLFNFLLLIGWHPKEDREVVTREEAIKEFSLDRVQKSGGAFNEEKLDWYNAYYIKTIPISDLFEYLKPFIPKEWINDKGEEFIINILEIEKERLKRLTDFRENVDFFFNLHDYSKDLLVWKNDEDQTLQSLEDIYKFIKNMSDNDFNDKNIKEKLEVMSDEVGGRGPVYSPFRVALSGKKSSPNGLDIAPILGKEETLRRLKVSIDKLKQ